MDMGQLKQLIAGLTLRQKIYIVAAAVLVVTGIIAFTRWRTERDFRPLYTGLAPEDANAVVQKLRETGVDFRLAENGTTVLAPSARVAETRIVMAGAGLPKSGRVGFELFDKTNFGVTDFAERINYRRALEGELERSVMALEEVETARVHLTFPKDSVFLEARQPAKASVLVKLRAGRKLSPLNVVAVAHLVASAVENLAPDAVSILDMNGNLLSRPRRSSLEGDEPSEAALDYRRQVEKDLVHKVNLTLEPLLGPEKFRAGASVDCDFSSGEQSEETFDPSRSVMVSSQKTEDVSGANQAVGQPGTASNLPRPTSRPGAWGSGMTRRTENIAYQSARVVRRMRLPQGTVRRMSISVLLDQNVRWEGVGEKARRILEPPAPETLKSIRDLVAAATGLNADRGDQLIVESLPFESTLQAEPPGAPAAVPSPVATGIPLPAWLQSLLQQKNPILLGVLSGGTLLLLLFVAFLFFAVRRKRKQVKMAMALREGKAAGELEGSVEEVSLSDRLAEQEQLKRKAEAEAINALKLPPVTTKKAEVLTKHLVETAKKDPVAMAQILRTWLYDVD